jgi:phosphoribosylformimino-5-aminoimidazole carboxamide ribotide isomerase
MHIGGGITPENASTYLDAGASHVIVTSYVFRDGLVNGPNLRTITRVVGRKRLVLDLSCKEVDGEYLVATDRWQKLTDVALSKQTLTDLSQYCDEFLVHGAHVEGKQRGIDEDLVELLGRYSPIPVTYAGGARSIEDLERIRILGRGKVDATIGSALDISGGGLPYADVVAWHRRVLV